MLALNPRGTRAGYPDIVVTMAQALLLVPCKSVSFQPQLG